MGVWRSFEKHINLQHPKIPLFALTKCQRSKLQHSKSFTVVIQPLSTRLIKPNFCFTLPPTQHHSFFRNQKFIHRKTAHFRMPSVAQNLRVLKLKVERGRRASHVEISGDQDTQWSAEAPVGSLYSYVAFILTTQNDMSDSVACEIGRNRYFADKDQRTGSSVWELWVICRTNSDPLRI